MKATMWILHLAPGQQTLQEWALESRCGETDHLSPTKGSAELPISLRHTVPPRVGRGVSTRRGPSFRAPPLPTTKISFHTRQSVGVEGTGSRHLKEFHGNSKTGLCVPDSSSLAHLHQLWVIPQYSTSHLLVVLEKVIGQ